MKFPFFIMSVYLDPSFLLLHPSFSSIKNKEKRNEKHRGFLPPSIFRYIDDTIFSNINRICLAIKGIAQPIIAYWMEFGM
jgi:hypothetical protein